MGEAAGEIVSSDSGGHGSSFLLRSPTEGFGFNHNPSTNSLDIRSFTSSGDSFTIHDPSGTDVSQVYSPTGWYSIPVPVMDCQKK